MTYAAVGISAGIGAGSSFLSNKQSAKASKKAAREAFDRGLLSYRPVDEALQGSFLPGVQELVDQGTGGIYQDTRLAGEDQYIGAGQDQLLRAGQQFENRGDSLYDSLQGFINYDPNSPQNAARQRLLGNQITQQFTQGIQPGIEDLGTSSGQFGGNQQNIALGAASQGLANAVGASQLGMMEGDRERAMRALGMAPQIANMGLVQGNLTEGIGNRRTMRDQLELEDEIQQFNAPRNADLQVLQEQQGLLAPFHSTSGAPAAQPVNYSNPLTSGLGAGLTMYDLLSRYNQPGGAINTSAGVPADTSNAAMFNQIG